MEKSKKKIIRKVLFFLGMSLIIIGICLIDSASLAIPMIPMAIGFCLTYLSNPKSLFDFNEEDDKI